LVTCIQVTNMLLKITENPRFEYTASFIDLRELRDCRAVLCVPVNVVGRYILAVIQTLVCECESR